MFLPEPGQRPARATPRRDERVLHVCLRVPGDPQTALANALRSLTTDGGEYAEVDWRTEGRRLVGALSHAASTIKPTLVFMQIQTPGVIAGDCINDLRQSCDPSCVVVQWDGDHRHNHVTGPDREWFVDLARGCDVNACVCTRDVEEYAEMGVKGAAYVNIGVDTDLWRPATPDPTGPDVLFLASFYKHLGYQTRAETVRTLSGRFPDRFAVYGYGWPTDANHRGFVPHEREAPLYSRSLCAISNSIRTDLPRYTSDRLLRGLASGALMLVESFPDMAGLGLRSGVNCISWANVTQLCEQIATILATSQDLAWQYIRQQARELALTHSWDSRMGELAYIVEAVRASR